MNGPNKTISFEVDGAFYDRLTNKLFAVLQGDPEDVIKFLLSQAMTAPEPAIRWMRERRLADLRPQEGHAAPLAKNVFEACFDAARERALQDNQAAISLAAAVRACCQ